MEWEVSLEELPGFALEFWKAAEGGSLFAFHGDMGAGKTTTIAALCRAKGVKDTLSSPTFSIINNYLYEASGREGVIYHIDLYRLRDEEEVRAAGVEDCVDSGAICFIEWPEKAPYLFEEGALHVLLEPLNESTRRVKLLTHNQFSAASMAEQL